MPSNPKYRPEPTNVPANKVRPLLAELVDRCGGQEQAARYAGLGRNTVQNVMTLKYDSVQKRTVRLVVLALHERRKEDRRNGASERFLKARHHQAQMEERLERLTGY